MAQANYDLVVIGAGPGGYVAAIHAAQHGLKTACVEREYLGGTCLNVGCIPSKALLDSSERFQAVKHGLSNHGINVADVSLDLRRMIARKDDVVKKNTDGVAYLFKKNKVDHLKGSGKIVAPDQVLATSNGTQRRIKAKNILIATGSAPTRIPALPFDGERIISSTEALSLTALPGKMAIVGAGYIGVELGSVFARLGVDVLLIEFLDRILPPSDKEMAGALQKLLEKQGLKFRFNTVAQSASVKGNKVLLSWKSGSDNGAEEVDKVLVCVGREPVTNGLGLDEVGIRTDSKGFITVDKQFRTGVGNIYAIGDVIGGIMLAHKAEMEGVAAVDAMLGRPSTVNYHACPSVVYTKPALAQVGLTEEQASARGRINVGKFPMMANGYARAIDEPDGLVKIIADADSDRILGIHILAAHASDMIAEAALAVEFAGSSEDLARAFHAHPTLPEALKEAALAVRGRAINI